MVAEVAKTAEAGILANSATTVAVASPLSGDKTSGEEVSCPGQEQAGNNQRWQLGRKSSLAQNYIERGD